MILAIVDSFLRQGDFYELLLKGLAYFEFYSEGLDWFLGNSI
jgi:hypothetical protein